MAFYWELQVEKLMDRSTYLYNFIPSFPASAEGPLSCDCVNLWPSGKLSHGGQHEVSMRSVEPKFLPRASSSPVGLGFVPY